MSSLINLSHYNRSEENKYNYKQIPFTKYLQTKLAEKLKKLKFHIVWAYWLIMVRNVFFLYVTIKYMQSYFTPTQAQRFEFEIKRSKFITSISPVSDKTQAKNFIQSLRNEFPDANHHCWAMIAGRPDDIYQQDQSDDGEPKGTAGKPMLNVLQHSNLGNIAVVVTRYFGGIKLGAGGLVRAYTQCVSESLKELKTVEFLIRDAIEIELPYSMLDSLEHAFKNTNIEISDKLFTDSIKLSLLVSENDKTLLKEITDTIGHGSIVILDKNL